MRDLIYIYERFKFCLENNKPMFVRENDLNAISNAMIDFNAEKDQSETRLLDALIGFFITIQFNKHKEVEHHKINLPSFETLYSEVVNKMKPINIIATELHTNLLIDQFKAEIPKDKYVTRDEIYELLNELIHNIKYKFKKIERENLVRELSKINNKY